MTRYFVAMLFAVLVGVGATASPQAQAAGYGRCGNCGTVVDADRIYYDRRGYDDRYGNGRNDRDDGTQGLVAGAIIGGLLGNQVGGGSGKKAATVAGAVAGGLIGKKVDRNNGGGDGRGERGLRLEVRMDNGGYRTVEVHGDVRIYKGDRVRVNRDRVALL